MNLFLQNMILISFILFFCLISMYLFDVMRKNLIKFVSFKVPKEYYMYSVLVVLSSLFVFFNWNSCVNMQFFSSFNGYNIIFIVWIVLLILSLFKIDFNGISFAKKEEKVFDEKYNNAGSYMENSMSLINEKLLENKESDLNDK